MRRVRLGTIERVELIEKIARKIASIQGYAFSESKQMQADLNPRSQMYVAMAIAAIEEFESS